MDSLLKMISIINAVGCTTPAIENWSKEPWGNHDTAIYSNAIERCKVHFGDDAPCLKKFIKKGDNHYYAICGRNTKQVHSAPLDGHYWFSIVDIKDEGQKDCPAGGTNSSGQVCKGSCPTRKGLGGSGK